MSRHLRDAAAWADRLADFDDATGDADRLERWLSDPDNAAHLDRLQALRAAIVDLAGEPALAAARRQARARAARPARRPLLVAALVSASVAAGALLAVTAWPRADEVAPAGRGAASQQVAFVTAHGERRSWRLPDGSRLSLDTDSAAELDFSAQHRRVVMRRGQAMFDVARDPRRDFEALAGASRVVAHGTVFNVRLTNAVFRVDLVEGAVSVLGPGRRVSLKPGQSLIERAGRRTLADDPEAVRVATGWREGRLVFQDEALADAVAEMNRYLAEPIRLGDDRVGAIRISGAFKAGETAGFLSALEAGFPVVARRDATGGVTLSRAPGKT